MQPFPSISPPQPFISHSSGYKKEDNESLESAEILGVSKGLDQEYSVMNSTPYQLPLSTFADDKVYNPLDPMANQPANTTTIKPINPPTAPQKTCLIPWSYDNETPEKTISAPLGSLLKIWSGKIHIGKSEFNSSMLTCDNIEDYYQTPALSLNIEINGRVKLPLVFDYLNRNAKTLHLLKGWVTMESNSETTTILGNYLLEMENTAKCGVIDLKEIGSRLYLIPWNNGTQEFLQKWEINPVCANSRENSLVKFAYFFAYKKQNIFKIYKPMRPSIMKLAEVSQPIADSAFTGIPQVDVISDDEAPLNNENKIIPKSEDETKKALKEKLASFSEEEINTLKSQLVGSNREDLDKLLDEIAQERNNEYPPEDTHKNYMMNENLNYANKSSINYSENYDPIYDPMSHLGQQIENNPNGEEEMKDNYPLESNEFEKDGTDYMSKVWKLQGFINKNGLFFIQYAQNLEFEQPYQIM